MFNIFGKLLACKFLVGACKNLKHLPSCDSLKWYLTFPKSHIFLSSYDKNNPNIKFVLRIVTYNIELNKLSRILTVRIFLWNLSDVK